MTRLTDKQLVNLYKNLVNDYQNESRNYCHLDGFHQYQAIYNSLYSKFYFTLCSDPDLKDFSLCEQEKAWNVFYTVMQAHNAYLFLREEERKALTTWVKKSDYHKYSSNRYSVNKEQVFIGFMPVFHTPLPYQTRHCLDNPAEDEAMVILVMVVIATLAIAVTLLAAYYILSAALNALERFVYDEDWLSATLTLASISTGVTMGACLGYFIVAPLIIGLGLSNPVFLSILALGSIVCLSIVCAGIITFAINKLQDKWDEEANPDALDPKDPYRYLLTEDQMQKLFLQGYNIEAVKCAITALRLEMDTEKVPSLLNRWNPLALGKTRLIHKNLQLIRQLKAANLDSDHLIVGNMNFPLKMQAVQLSPCNEEDLPLYQPMQPFELSPVYR